MYAKIRVPLARVYSTDVSKQNNLEISQALNLNLIVNASTFLLLSNKTVFCVKRFIAESFPKKRSIVSFQHVSKTVIALDID